MLSKSSKSWILRNAKAAANTRLSDGVLTYSDYNEEKQGEQSYVEYMSQQQDIQTDCPPDHHPFCCMVHSGLLNGSDSGKVLRSCYGLDAHKHSYLPSSSSTCNYSQANVCPTAFIKKRRCPADLSTIAKIAGQFSFDDRFAQLMSRLGEGPDPNIHATEVCSDPVVSFMNNVESMFCVSMIKGEVRSVIDIISRLYFEIMIHINAMRRMSVSFHPRTYVFLRNRVWDLCHKFYCIVDHTKHLFATVVNSYCHQEQVYDAWWCLLSNINHLLDPKPLIFTACVFCLTEKIKVPPEYYMYVGLYNSATIPQLSQVSDMLKHLSKNVLGKTVLKELHVESHIEYMLGEISELITFANNNFGCSLEENKYIVSTLVDSQPCSSEERDYMAGRFIGIFLFLNLCTSLYRFLKHDPKSGQEIDLELCETLKRELEDIYHITHAKKYLADARKQLQDTIVGSDSDTHGRFLTYLLAIIENHCMRTGASSKDTDTIKMNTFVGLLLGAIVKVNPLLSSWSEPGTNIFTMKFDDILKLFGEEGKLTVFFGRVTCMEYLLHHGAVAAANMNGDCSLSKRNWDEEMSVAMEEISLGEDLINRYLKEYVNNVSLLRSKTIQFNVESKRDEEHFWYWRSTLRTVDNITINACISEIIKCVLDKSDIGAGCFLPHEIVFLSTKSSRNKRRNNREQCKRKEKSIPCRDENTETLLWKEFEYELKAVRTDSSSWVNGASKELLDALENSERIRSIVMVVLILEILINIPQTTPLLEAFWYNLETGNLTYYCKERFSTGRTDNIMDGCYNRLVDTTFSSLLGIIQDFSGVRDECPLDALLNNPRPSSARERQLIYSSESSTAFRCFLFKEDVDGKALTEVIHLFLDNERRSNSFIQYINNAITILTRNKEAITRCLYKYRMSNKMNSHTEIYVNRGLAEIRRGAELLENILVCPRI